MTETKRPAFIDLFILIREIIDTCRSWLLKFCRSRISDTTNIPSKFDDCKLQTETDTEKWDIFLTSESDSRYLSLYSSRTESTWDNHAIHFSFLL